MSVTTVYVTSPGYSFTQNHESGGDWNTKWSATTGNNGTTDEWGVNCYRGSGSYDIYRRTALYNTSAVPANATVSSVVYNAYVKKVHDGDCTNSIIYLCSVSATGNSAGYYNRSYFGTALASLDKQNVESDNVNEWWRPNLAAGSIVKAGTTILGLRHYQDYANAAPWNDGTGQFYFSPHNDSTYKSYLVITWTTPPACTTGLATNLQPISATLAGQVTDFGGGTVSSMGICWSQSENPTTADSKGTDVDIGMSVEATGLLPGTLYHYRAFVTTENSTQYGADATFRTPGGAILFNLL